MHPSTGSGRTEAHCAPLGIVFPRLFTLRQAQGERKCILGIVFPGSRLRANGSAHWGSSSLAVLRQAQGERKRILGIVFPGCAPFDRLRANGSEHWGSSSLAVHPSTGSGRTEAHFGDRLPRLCALRQAQGERKSTLGIVFPGCSPFDRLRANGREFWGLSSLCGRLRANGSAHGESSSPAVRPSTGSGRTEGNFGDRLPWQFTLRQAQGERTTPLMANAPTLSVASPESPLRHRADAPCGIARDKQIAQKPSVALPKSLLRMPLDG